MATTPIETKADRAAAIAANPTPRQLRQVSFRCTGSYAPGDLSQIVYRDEGYVFTPRMFSRTAGTRNGKTIYTCWIQDGAEQQECWYQVAERDFVTAKDKAPVVIKDGIPYAEAFTADDTSLGVQPIFPSGYDPSPNMPPLEPGEIRFA